ncbi:MAG: hypothetical protein R3B84_19485 [Zavarzinella sp.]
MRKILVIGGLLAVLGVGAFLYFYKKEDTLELKDKLAGYGSATTPDECVTRFQKAIKERNYKMAAKYVSAEYAEQFVKAAEAAEAFGEAIDDLDARLEQSGVKSDEAKLMLYFLDPLPKTTEVKLAKTGDTEAVASITITCPNAVGLKDAHLFSDDSLDARIMGALFRNNAFAFNAPATYSYVTNPKLVQEGEKKYWKIQLVVNPVLRARVDFLNANYKEYVNILNKLSSDVKTDATTKSNVNVEFANLLREAKGK